MSVIDALGNLSRHSSPLGSRDFETEPNQTGTDSPIGTLTADAVLALKHGRSNPIKLAIPAYESFQTAGDGSEQTFNLSHSLIDPPDTQAAIVWFGNSYEGVPTFDTDADTVTVTGPGTVETVHVFYVSDAPATLTIRKEQPSAKTQNTEELYEGNLSLVQSKNQNEQPEFLRLGRSALQPFLAADMDLIVSIDAPYTVRFIVDGAQATNALVQLPAWKGEDDVEGLSAAIARDMATR